jgi:hypothetical protein
MLSDEKMAGGPRQRSHSGPSSAGVVTIFYCLKFETPPTPYLYPPGTAWPIYTPRHWVPFSSPPTILRATVELFDSPPHGMEESQSLDLKYVYCNV